MRKVDFFVKPFKFSHEHVKFVHCRTKLQVTDKFLCCLHLMQIFLHST